MAQRINPNILKLKTSKGMFNNSHYKNLSKNKNQLLKYQEDLFLQKFIEGFYFIFNFFTSEIIINRQQSNLNLNFLIFINDLNENYNRLNNPSRGHTENKLLPRFPLQGTGVGHESIEKNKLVKKQFMGGIFEKKLFKKSNYISKYNTIDYLFLNEIKQK